VRKIIKGATSWPKPKIHGAQDQADESVAEALKRKREKMVLDLKAKVAAVTGKKPS